MSEAEKDLEQIRALVGHEGPGLVEEVEMDRSGLHDPPDA